MRLLVAAAVALLAGLAFAAAARSREELLPDSFYGLMARTLEDQDFSFEELKGKVVLITNIASECGYTEDNYEKLTLLQNEFAEDLVVIGFPCNQFGKQEPGPGRVIRAFANQHGASFKIMAKTDVNGIRMHPVYRWLRNKTNNDDIQWK